jgi:hypothetical protein
MSSATPSSWVSVTDPMNECLIQFVRHLEFYKRRLLDPIELPRGEELLPLDIANVSQGSEAAARAVSE